MPELANMLVLPAAPKERQGREYAAMQKHHSLHESPQYVRVLSIFILASFAAIFATTIVLSTYMASYMKRQMMQRDAMVSMEFLNSIVHVEGAERFFFERELRPTAGEMGEVFEHILQLPEMARANIYSLSGEVIWSSDPALIGRTFDDNEELSGALRGELHPAIASLDFEHKIEHAGLPDDVEEFVEIYVPIWSSDGTSVIGAIEVYKTPTTLLAVLQDIERLAQVGALLAGAVLFAALISVVIYTMRTLHWQEKRLVEAERLAVIGEMASAIAHGLRNPLAAIRSCAELVAEEKIEESTRQTVLDIVDQVDRLEVWIRSFLNGTRAEPQDAVDTAHVDVIIKRCIESFRPQLLRHNIEVVLGRCDGHPIAAAGSGEMEQVVNTILANAVEAMKNGGRLHINWSNAPGRRIAIEISDTGPGLDEDQLQSLFVPFKTSKPSGLGVGLALGRRIAERFGGTLDLRNGIQKGVVVTLTFPARA
ncbi:MAG: sensor histidine kinase [Limimaricola soesokkakensis]|uniref:sensor histidine kinase n=1 Tax=Limimaricola soesokkakensis TaxID=1343159 RepID=UPI004058831E